MRPPLSLVKIGKTSELPKKNSSEKTTCSLLRPANTPSFPRTNIGTEIPIEIRRAEPNAFREPEIRPEKAIRLNTKISSIWSPICNARASAELPWEVVVALVYELA
ncbi:MAG: hypothetical protein TQ35_0010430 [Candidatus Aramenus sulfurataquae]|uniref:Uncharacterized protein n=1 Tax=Candidatus Aramenus sulfurataquae TaxID=1326980 RepID=A0ACC6TS99_9CREN